MKRRAAVILALVLSALLGACVPPPSPGTPTVAAQAQTMTLLGKWAPLVAGVPVHEVAADAPGPDAPAWTQPGGTADHRSAGVYLRPGTYSHSLYVVAHELAHALGWAVSTTVAPVPDGWWWGVENWADCVAVAMGAVALADIGWQPGYGCQTDALAWTVHYLAGPVPAVAALWPLG